MYFVFYMNSLYCVFYILRESINIYGLDVNSGVLFKNFAFN